MFDRPLTRRALFGGAAAAASGIAFAASTQNASAVSNSNGMTATFWSRDSARDIASSFHSTALNRDVSVRILLPAGYDDDARRHYPVVFLLHGSGGDANSWVDLGGAREATAGVDAIFVMPDGGHGGWYTNHDHVSSGIVDWESFHCGQLPYFIDNNLRTLGRGSGRAIAGFSMGGYGAAIYAGRHPDLFKSLTVFSGATDAYDMNWRNAMYSAPGQDGENTGAVYGVPAGQENPDDLWRRNPGSYAANLKGRRVRLFTGRESWNGEDRLRASTGVFNKALADAGVTDVEWIGLDGGHDWSVAAAGLRQDVRGLVESIDRVEYR